MKIVVRISIVIILFYTLIGCSASSSKQDNTQVDSGAPENVRSDIWIASLGLLNEITSYYEDGEQLDENAIEEHGEVFKQYLDDNGLSEQELLLLDQVSNLITYTFLLVEGYSVDKLKDVAAYDFEAELNNVKELLNK